ncbi:uncharacterized protein LOC143425990 [Xylocopa sonorina]|uniref:uncharacterized protein LOC143425990 n=1 Tax=Xylocopa sonorina TaxID=1818115 RepID=UPI00403AFB6F
MHANQNGSNPGSRSQPSRLFRNRRLDRPEDAKALDLRVPDSENASLKSNSTSSRNSARLSVSKYVRKRPNDDSRTKRDVKRHPDAETKATTKLLDPQEERKASGGAALGTLGNLQTKLGRGLKSISNKSKARAMARLETKKGLNSSAGLNPSSLGGARRLSIGGKKARRNSLSSEEGKTGKAKKESKSTKQLFSTSESWSNDSVVSHSDNCACCHSREPCPFHGCEPNDGK